MNWHVAALVITVPATVLAWRGFCDSIVDEVLWLSVAAALLVLDALLLGIVCA